MALRCLSLLLETPGNTKLLYRRAVANTQLSRDNLQPHPLAPDPQLPCLALPRSSSRHEFASAICDCQAVLVAEPKNPECQKLLQTAQASTAY